MVGVRFIISSFILFLCSCGIPDLSPMWLITELQSSDHTHKLFIKVRGNGIGSPERIVIVSTKKNKKIENGDMVFSSIQPIFYQQKNDTLYIYTDKNHENSANLSSPIKVVEKIVTNRELMNKCDTYQSEGLTIIR